jgi:hypothetical protein
MTDRRAQETLTALIKERTKVYDLMQVRRAMGGFDANAEAIMTILSAISAILDYEITKAEKEKH